MAQHKQKKSESSLTRRSESSLYPEYSSSLKITPISIPQRTPYFCSDMFSPHHVLKTPHKHGNTQNTSCSVPDDKESEFSYLQESIILCKSSHAHVFSTRLPTVYFFTL